MTEEEIKELVATGECFVSDKLDIEEKHEDVIEMVHKAIIDYEKLLLEKLTPKCSDNIAPSPAEYEEAGRLFFEDRQRQTMIRNIITLSLASPRVQKGVLTKLQQSK